MDVFTTAAFGVAFEQIAYVSKALIELIAPHIHANMGTH